MNFQTIDKHLVKILKERGLEYTLAEGIYEFKYTKELGVVLNEYKYGISKKNKNRSNSVSGKNRRVRR